MDGDLSDSQTGSTRYDLLEEFNNPASSVDGAAPGTVEFSSIGAPLSVGIAIAPPTGGSSFADGRIAADALFAEMGRSTGPLSEGELRSPEAIALAITSNGYNLSGAASDALFGELGRDHTYEYCFAAGTLVLTKDGPKPIETIEPGEFVYAASDRDPTGPVELKPVVEVYHNQPARLLNLHFGEDIIRSTFNHPFWVEGRGWIAAEKIQVGDCCRSREGKLVPLTDRFDNGEVEPVYNLHVAECRTYFVALVHSNQPLLVIIRARRNENLLLLKTTLLCKN